MKTQNKLKNPPDWFNNLSIKYGMTVMNRKESSLQLIANEIKRKSNSDDSENFIF